LTGQPPGAWTVGALAAGRVGGLAADTARRASTVIRNVRATPCSAYHTLGENMRILTYFMMGTNFTFDVLI